MRIRVDVDSFESGKKKLRMKIYDIAFWWVFLSMYIIIQNIRICVDGAFKFAITVSRAILIRWKSNTRLFFNQTPIVQICTKEINCEIAFQPYLYSLQWHILGMLSNAVFTSKNSFTYCITKVTFVRKINPRASNIVFSFLFKSEFNDSKTHWDLSSTWNWSKQLWE